MPIAVSLDGVTMFVSSTAQSGVVDAQTHIAFRQRGLRITGRYAGGRIRRGVLIGAVSGTNLTFRYLQVEASGEIHGGRSSGEIEQRPDGRLRILERFSWTTRDGSGTNVFDELRTNEP